MKLGQVNWILMHIEFNPVHLHRKEMFNSIKILKKRKFLCILQPKFNKISSNINTSINSVSGKCMYTKCIGLGDKWNTVIL